MPAGAAAAIGAFGTVAGAGIQAAATGGSSASGFSLPPALELQLLDHFQANLTSLDKDYTKIGNINTAFKEKIDAIDGMLNKTLPTEDAMQQLTAANMRLAEHMGLSADELVQNGYLTESEAAGLKSLENMESSKFEDPTLRNQLSDQKARLMQDLRRSGASQNTIDQAMRQFDRDAEEKLFSRSQELKTSQAALITSRLGLGRQLRTAGVQESLSTLGATTGLQQQNVNTLLQRANLAGNVAQAGAEALKLQQETARFRDIGSFQEIGKFIFSRGTRRLMRTAGAEGKTKLPSAYQEFVATAPGYTSDILKDRA